VSIKEEPRKTRGLFNRGDAYLGGRKSQGSLGENPELQNGTHVYEMYGPRGGKGQNRGCQEKRGAPFAKNRNTPKAGALISRWISKGKLKGKPCLDRAKIGNDTRQ